MNSIKTIFIRGLLAIVPITATIFLLVWLGRSAENALGGLIRTVLPEQYYVPGLGVLFALVLIFLIGVFLNAWMAQKLLNWVENLLQSLPFIKSIYSPMKDLMGLFSSKSSNDLKRVVMVDMDNGRKIFGLATRDSFLDLGLKEHEDKVAIYFPMSYQIGGYTILVPKDQVTEVDLPVDRALSLMVTGWVKGAD